RRPVLPPARAGPVEIDRYHAGRAGIGIVSASAVPCLYTRRAPFTVSGVPPFSRREATPRVPRRATRPCLVNRIAGLQQRRYGPIDQAAAGQARQRWPGAGRRSALSGSEDQLLFVLVYLKTL